MTGEVEIYRSPKGWLVYVVPGSKGPGDFIVKFKQPGRPRLRTPKHIHMVVDLFAKKAKDSTLVEDMCSQFVRFFDECKPATTYPPVLEMPVKLFPRFAALAGAGEFEPEFLVAVNYLLAIQEKTNYPNGRLTRDLYQNFATKDVFTLVQKATWRGP